MANNLQEFHYGSPKPKNATKHTDKSTREDPVSHPASEILKTIGKLALNERIIIFVKDAAQAALECDQSGNIIFRENSPESAKEIQDAGHASLNSEEASGEPKLRMFVIGAASPVAKAMINLRTKFEVWLQIRTDTGFWRHGMHCASTPIGILSSEKWQEKISEINLIQAEHDPIFRITVEADRGKAAFKFRESAAHDENAKYIGRLDNDPMPRKRYEITIEGEDQELEPFKKLCKDGTARKINRRKMPDGRIRLTLDLPTEQPLDASQFAKETRFISIAKDDKLREGVCIYLKDTTQSKQIAEAIENDEMLRNRATRESPKWFQLGGNVADITKKLHQKRQEGNITSDVSYRAWTVSDDSTITIWCGMIDGTGEDWVEVKAKVEERVDTEIANKIMRALGICFKNRRNESRDRVDKRQSNPKNDCHGVEAISRAGRRNDIHSPRRRIDYTNQSHLWREVWRRTN